MGKRRTFAPDFKLDFTLSLHFLDPAGTLVLRPGTRTILGRRDADFPDEIPDIDLTPYQAAEKGVSRLHAAITVMDGIGIYIQDLGSGGETYASTLRVLPGHVELLEGRRQIRLGKLAALVTLDLAESDLIPYCSLMAYVRIINSNDISKYYEYWRYTWYALLLLAYEYGWKPSLWRSSGGIKMSAADALALADALECALPDLGEDSPAGFARALGREPFIQSVLSDLSDWFGDNGRRNVRGLMTFCRDVDSKDEVFIVSWDIRQHDFLLGRRLGLIHDYSEPVVHFSVLP